MVAVINSVQLILWLIKKPTEFTNADNPLKALDHIYRMVVAGSTARRGVDELIFFADVFARTVDGKIPHYPHVRLVAASKI
jgi:hypothetical protein